jgi:hypothetical protein
MLKRLAAQTSLPMTNVLEQALESYQRKLFLAQVNAGYAELRASPRDWAEHQAERKLWDTTIADGLEAEHWSEEGRCVTRPRRGKKKHG